MGAGGIQGAEHRCQVGTGGGAEKGAVRPKDLQPRIVQRSGTSGQADICLVTAGTGEGEVLHRPAGQGPSVVLAKAGRYPVHWVVHSLKIESVITHTCSTGALDDDGVTPVNVKEAVGGCSVGPGIGAQQRPIRPFDLHGRRGQAGRAPSGDADIGLLTCRPGEGEAVLLAAAGDRALGVLAIAHGGAKDRFLYDGYA